MIYPVITLYQPWATWIIRGWKTIETRTHPRLKNLLHKRILLHAGQTTDGSDEAIKNPYLTLGQIVEKPEEMINGYIIGSAHVYGWRELFEGDSQAALIECGKTRRWGTFLNDVKKWPEPIQEKGERGVWYYDFDAKKKSTKAEYMKQFNSCRQMQVNFNIQ